MAARRKASRVMGDTVMPTLELLAADDKIISLSWSVEKQLESLGLLRSNWK